MQIKTEEKPLKTKNYFKKSKVFTVKQSKNLYRVLKLAYENNFTYAEIYNFFYNAVKNGFDIDTATAEFEGIIKKRIEITPSGFSPIGSVIEIIMMNLKNSFL